MQQAFRIGRNWFLFVSCQLQLWLPSSPVKVLKSNLVCITSGGNIQNIHQLFLHWHVGRSLFWFKGELEPVLFLLGAHHVYWCICWVGTLLGFYRGIFGVFVTSSLRPIEIQRGPIFIWCFINSFTPLYVVKTPSASTLVFSLELLRDRISEILYVFVLLGNQYPVKCHWSAWVLTILNKLCITYMR